MIGFTFRGRHSSEFDIGFKSVDRTLIPERRKREFEIAGRSGTYELASDEYDKRKISGVLGVMNNVNFEKLREKSRELAFWLSGSGLLIFDDEKDKAYEASVYNATGIEQLKLQPRGIVNIVFDCQPFAISQLNQMQKNGRDSVNLKINSKGNTRTQATFIIKCKNTGIKTIRITRKVVI